MHLVVCRLKWKKMLFFNLPRELRDIVYDELFQGVSLTCSNHEIRREMPVVFHFFYKFNGNRKHRNLPLWLFTSKQILREAMTQWYKGASCSPCFCGRDQGRTTPGTYASAFCELDRAQSFEAPVLSNMYGDFGDYVLWPKLRTRKTPNVQILVPRMSDEQHSYSVMDCFFNYIVRNPTHPAKTVMFSLAMAPSEFLVRGIDSVDLSWFEALGPHFDRVIFRVKCPFTRYDIFGSSNWPKLRDTLTMYSKLQDEAIRVGKFLVQSGDSTGWSVHDSLVPMLDYTQDVIPDAFEWHVEVERRQTQQKEHIRYGGMRYCCVQRGRINALAQNREVIYFRPMQTNAAGQVSSWKCDATGQIISLY